MNSTRKTGLITFLIGGIGTALVVWHGMSLAEDGGRIWGYGWGLPAVVALIGLIQFVSGVPFSELSRRWDSLQGWQRGVLGTLILALSCGVIFLAILAFVTIAYES